jgi:hypothetical protein
VQRYHDEMSSIGERMAEEKDQAVRDEVARRAIAEQNLTSLHEEFEKRVKVRPSTARDTGIASYRPSSNMTQGLGVVSAGLRRQGGGDPAEDRDHAAAAG